MEFTDRTYHTGEIELHYLEGPRNGPPLVLIHGATGSCNEWGSIQGELARDWHLYLLDQRGHGLSGRAPGPAEYHASRNINDTLAFLRNVVQEPAVVWGHSWGAIVTMLSAGIGKEMIRAIILEDPPVMIRREICPEMKPYMDYFGGLMQLKQRESTMDGLRAAIQKFIPGVPAEALENRTRNASNVDANFLRIVLAGPEIVAGIDMAQAIRAASMPVLLLRADPAKGAALAEEDLAFVLENNPNFQLVDFPGSGHGIHSEQAEKVLEMFRKFVEPIMTPSIPSYWRWFNEARYGLFIHWGAYSQYGRGEQVLFREHLDQAEYATQARSWRPTRFDARAWAEQARAGGFRYAVLTTRHHDGFCLWNSKLTRYSTAAQAAGRDFVGEYVEAMRSAGLRVGLYYSLADWRVPAYWEGPAKDPEGWAEFREYVHGQVRELLSSYGKIDLIWFDGAWPHSALDWKSPELVEMIRSLQPEIMINNRLGLLPVEGDPTRPHADGGAGVGESRTLGDFGTPEHHITAETGRMWESCQVSTWRLWGYTIGERFRPADLLLDMLVESASKGGNLLLNVGPTPEGEFPPEFLERSAAIGRWLEVHGEAIYASEAGEVCEFITYGRQTKKANNLYLVIRFWDGRGEVHLAGLETPVERAVLLTTGQVIPFEQTEDHLVLRGLPRERPNALFPVIHLECAAPPQPRPWAAERLWNGDAARMVGWAKKDFLNLGE